MFIFSKKYVIINILEPSSCNTWANINQNLLNNCFVEKIFNKLILFYYNVTNIAVIGLGTINIRYKIKV